MTTLDPAVEEAFRNFAAQVQERVPALREILDAMRGLPEDEVMRRLLEVTDERVALEVERLATEMLAPLREASIKRDVVLPPRHPGGIPRIDPMYSAALQERAQFDGDVPELRTGPLPHGAEPAVPVATNAASAVTVGWMLEAASSEVAAELRAIEANAVDQVTRLLSDSDPGEKSLTPSDPAVLAHLERARLPDPAGYERGRMPVLRSTRVPDGGEMALLSPEQRGQLAWRFVSTTQGRRSVLATIRALVLSKLKGGGFDVEAHEGAPLVLTRDQVVAYEEWVLDLSGPRTIQHRFAFVDTAANVLAAKLRDKGVGVPLVLEILTVDTVDVRRVGWAARLSHRAG